MATMVSVSGWWNEKSCRSLPPGVRARGRILAPGRCVQFALSHGPERIVGQASVEELEESSQVKVSGAWPAQSVVDVQKFPRQRRQSSGASDATVGHGPGPGGTGQLVPPPDGQIAHAHRPASAFCAPTRGYSWTDGRQGQIHLSAQSGRTCRVDRHQMSQSRHPAALQVQRPQLAWVQSRTFLQVPPVGLGWFKSFKISKKNPKKLVKFIQVNPNLPQPFWIIFLNFTNFYWFLVNFNSFKIWFNSFKISKNR